MQLRLHSRFLSSTESVSDSTKLTARCVLLRGHQRTSLPACARRVSVLRRSHPVFRRPTTC